MNTLRSFLLKHYGSTAEAAKHLNLSAQAINKWTSDSPRNALKYMPEILKYTGVSADYLLVVVMATMHELSLSSD